VKVTHLLLCTLATITLAARADAQVLYAAIGAGQPGELYTLNQATGAMATDIGPLTDAGGTRYGLTGLAFNPATGVLYGSTDSHSGTQLVTVNPATARVTVVGPYGIAGGTTMTDLAFTAAGQLYGISSTGGANLYSINPATGAATQVSAAGSVPTFTEGGGLAVSPAGVFDGTPVPGEYGTYDPATGAYTHISTPPSPAGAGGSYAALAFSGSGALYGINLLPGSGGRLTHLVTFDPPTGTVTDIGPSITALDAIAFSPVPEPGTLALLIGPVAVGLVRVRRRRK
jgi:hypothetical protein